MSINSDKLAHVQVVINFRNINAQLCTREDGLAYISGASSIDDVVSYNSLTTILFKCIGTSCFKSNLYLIPKQELIDLYTVGI